MLQIATGGRVMNSITMNQASKAVGNASHRRRASALRKWRITTALVLSTVLHSQISLADEGGVSFWLPGIYGSLAAVPPNAGWSLALIGYHTSVDAGSDVAFARQVARGRLTTNLNTTFTARLNADADLALVIPSYTFETPVLGGRMTVGMMSVVGRTKASVDATLTASLGPLGFTTSGGRTDSVSGFGDLIPQAALRWNQGVHNYMTYVTGDIPVGNYDPNRLANLGIGHGAIDGGVGYTYFNPLTGHEFSIVTGLTGNFENTNTNYTNGVDWHADWGASQFLSKQLHVGVVGYFYNQISGDSGSGDRVGEFKSRVIGIGPQLGYIFPIGESHQGYLNLKGYKEFDASHRPEGWNAWLTFVISQAGPGEAPPPPKRPLITK
jgi:hypothetical protein